MQLDAGTAARRLKQDVTTAVVETAGELKEALESSPTHIVIQSHLNLTSLPVFDSTTSWGPPWGTVLGGVPASVQSIRVCSTVPLAMHKSVHSWTAGTTGVP